MKTMYGIIAVVAFFTLVEFLSACQTLAPESASVTDASEFVTEELTNGNESELPEEFVSEGKLYVHQSIVESIPGWQPNETVYLFCGETDKGDTCDWFNNPNTYKEEPKRLVKEGDYYTVKIDRGRE